MVLFYLLIIYLFFKILNFIKKWFKLLIEFYYKSSMNKQKQSKTVLYCLLSKNYPFYVILLITIQKGADITIYSFLLENLKLIKEILVITEYSLKHIFLPRSIIKNISKFDNIYITKLKKIFIY